ncbi:hypothetical protein WME99_20695 [Sorangium sp. So ce136]|uniref:hypothetical protein n=1 Tax=Sorangium sp. So ce136 TaxID=3133284 RepID=UPI003F0DC67D
MSKLRFSYQSEKLSQARSALMAPHPGGEARSFASAFEFCSRAFHNFDIESVKDQNARHWIETIKTLMNTKGVQDTTGEGTYVHRARAMSTTEKTDFSRAVSELASWFDREFWSST